jgi:hypothetical protein
MKTTFPRTLAVALATLLASAAFGAVDGRKAPDTGPTILVDVRVPIMWRPLLEDDIEKAFSERLELVFRDRGFTGRLRVIDDAERKQPRANLNILTLHLLEWRVDRLGSVQCRFTAVVRTATGEKELGTFAATSWLMDRSRWSLRGAMDDVARNALTDLYDKLLRSDLLPRP